MATAREPASPVALPDHLSPMLPVLGTDAFDSSDKIFEVKWDGIRAIAFLDGDSVRLQSRNLKDITAQFQDIAAQLRRAVRADGVVLDGELVALDREGLPSLPLVTERLNSDDPHPRRPAVNYEVFDILYKAHQPLLQEPLWRRKAILHDTLHPTSHVHICHFEEAEGVTFFEEAIGLGLEGMVAKDKHSFYYPGRRSRQWLKVKAYKTANLVVGGYTFGGGPRKELFGSLLLGAFENRALRYVGSVGGGFTAHDLKSLYTVLSTLHAPRSPFADPPSVQRFLYWCAPKLVVQVKYAEVTDAGSIRFPIFVSTRPDIDPVDCRFTTLGQ